MTKQLVIQTRVGENHKAKLNEIKKHFNAKDNSEAVRRCIDLVHSTISEEEKYLINFYNIDKSKLYKLLMKDKNVKG